MSDEEEYEAEEEEEIEVEEELQDTEKVPDVGVEDTTIDPESSSWRVRAAVPTRDEWAWDIPNYKFNLVDEEIPTNVISSGNAGEDYEGFDGEMWGGRQDDDGELWLGLQCDEGSILPTSLELKQNPEGHSTGEVVVEFLDGEGAWVVWGQFIVPEGRVLIPIFSSEG